MTGTRHTSVLQYEKSQPRYFIWIRGWLRAEAEAQIVLEDMLPKVGLLFKKELIDDEFKLSELIAAFPCPVIAETENANR